MAKKTPITIVIPLYNEAGNIVPLFKRIRASIPSRYSAIYVLIDDGSTDKTLSVLQQLASASPEVTYLSFTRNFGHQYALKAGLDIATGDAVITLDGDGQHPPELIPELLKAWENGNKIVYTRRLHDPRASLLKNTTSTIFYKLINLMSETKIDIGSADFRLLDREVVVFVRDLRESTLFLRGLVTWSGFSSYAIDYLPSPRVWGISKYSYSRMVRLAIDAITSFSIVPLRFATVIGLFMSLFTGLYGLYALIAWVVGWHVITGWPSVIISVLFIGGLQLLMLGIIGEYIGKIFLETKKRPLYMIKEKRP